MTSNLFLRPTRGDFDVAALRSYLDARPDTFPDPHGTGYYIVCGWPESVQGRWEERKRDASRFPRACFIEVTPRQVIIVQESADDDGLRSVLEFARWMWSHGDLVVSDYYGRDVTEECQSEGIDALYPDRVKNLPIPWADRLIKVGFFPELDHGDISQPRLQESRAETPMPDEDRIVTYLEAGHVLVVSSDIAEDWLAEEPDVMIGPPHILTDGAYAWPADLPYYVRNYHVRLPRHFVLHVQRNNFQVPGNIDLGGLQLI